jgi:hypothetical protein
MKLDRTERFCDFHQSFLATVEVLYPFLPNPFQLINHPNIRRHIYWILTASKISGKINTGKFLPEPN